jgi:hypothetical protein
MMMRMRDERSGGVRENSQGGAGQEVDEKLDGVDSESARRARKRAKHTMMTPVSSALMNKERAYGARKSEPRVSMLGSTASLPMARIGYRIGHI